MTDFLASHNISAAQIRQDHEARRRAAEQDARQNGEAEESPAQEVQQRNESAEQKKKRKRKEEAAVAKIKKSKQYQKKKSAKAQELGKSDDDLDDDDDDDLAWEMYAKSKPLPGQLANCEICEKRFTVTSYSKTGPDGGLLCPKCSKEVEAERKKDEKKKAPPISRDKRRKVQSNLLDGLIAGGAKTLQELCVEVGECSSRSNVLALAMLTMA